MLWASEPSTIFPRVINLSRARAIAIAPPRWKKLSSEALPPHQQSSPNPVCTFNLNNTFHHTDCAFFLHQVATLTPSAITANCSLPRNARARLSTSSPSYPVTVSMVVAILAPIGLCFTSTQTTRTRIPRRMARIVALWPMMERRRENLHCARSLIKKQECYRASYLDFFVLYLVSGRPYSARCSKFLYYYDANGEDSLLF